MLVAISASAAHARPAGSLAERGDTVHTLSGSKARTVLVVTKPGSEPGDFIRETLSSRVRVHQLFVRFHRVMTLSDDDGRLGIFDGRGRPLAPSFRAGDYERELRAQLDSSRARSSVLVAGALLGAIKGLQACKKLAKKFLLKPVAKACEDFLERKLFRLTAKLVGTKVALSLFTCSQALPKRTPGIVRRIAAVVCG